MTFPRHQPSLGWVFGDRRFHSGDGVVGITVCRLQEGRRCFMFTGGAWVVPSHTTHFRRRGRADPHSTARPPLDAMRTAHWPPRVGVIARRRRFTLN